MPKLIDYFAPEKDTDSHSNTSKLFVPDSRPLTYSLNLHTTQGRWIMAFIVYNPFLYSLLFIPFLTKENQDMATEVWYHTYAAIRWKIPLAGIIGVMGIVFLALAVRYRSLACIVLSMIFSLSSLVIISAVLYKLLLF